MREAGKGMRKGRRLATLFVLISGLLASAHAAEAPQSRDGVWRMIFARPAVSQPVSPPDLAARISLGHDLFRDERLSGAADRSCATCHEPAKAFSDGRARAIGLDGTPLARNVPALADLAFAASFLWDGRAASLEEQARVPILDAREMAGDFATIVARLEADGAMRERFAAAFPGEARISEASIVGAIAAYERTLASPVSRFDRWVAGEDKALGAKERAGLAVFVGKGGCVACHGGWRLTDGGFHDIGLLSADRGRGAIDPFAAGARLFKTPSLRQVARTAPYMHDGSIASLRDVVDHYAGGFEARPSLDSSLRRDLVLSRGEKEALVAFLEVL